MVDNFEIWNQTKKRLDSKNKLRTFKQREIWWCSIGINVGHEENGKGATSNRPVLVIKKFNYRLFWGVPLTTQSKDTPHYHAFSFLGKPQNAMLTQARLWDAARLSNCMGRLSEKEFNAIRKDLIASLT